MSLRARILMTLGLVIVAACSDGVTMPSAPSLPSAPSPPSAPAPPTVGSIDLELEADTLSVGQSTQLRATVLSAGGDTLAGRVRFVSRDEDVATVSKEGLVTAIGTGTATIAAQAGAQSATITVYVRGSEVGSVLLQPDSLTITLGDTARVAVFVRDTTGALIVDSQVVFRCIQACQGTIVTLDSSSFMFGSGTYSEGMMEIVARHGGVSSNTMRLMLAFGDPNNPWDY